MSTITRGTTNMFNDLRYKDGTERQIKTRLALTVNELNQRPRKTLGFKNAA